MTRDVNSLRYQPQIAYIDIETFTLSGHPEASEAFNWAFRNGNVAQYIAVIRVPPINDPSDAVRAAIASGHFK